MAALSGLHVICMFPGGKGKTAETLPAIRKPEWSQTLATAGTTTNAAPAPAIGSQVEPLFRLVSSAPAMVTIAPVPDVANGPRIYLRADVEYDIFVSPGDKIALIA